MAAGMVEAARAAFTLKRGSGTFAEGAHKLANEIGAASVQAVIAQANRQAARRPTTHAFGTMSPKPADWYGFDAKDEDTPDWYPQGLTSDADSGTVNFPVFVTSWYFLPEAGERGVRVTFLSPKTLRYQHALLVVAEPSGTYRPIDIHAGGIAWVGDLLYVADTLRGLRVFDLTKILDLRTVQDDLGNPAAIGRTGGVFSCFGYRYLIPQVDAWKLAAPGARFSFAAVDRTLPGGPALVAGEYLESAAGGRVSRWALAGDGTIAAGLPIDAYAMPEARIQGALSHKDTWYLSQTRGGAGSGRLLVCRPGGAAAKARSYAVGPEDLAVRAGKLWSVTEFRARRVIYGVAL